MDPQINKKHCGNLLAWACGGPGHPEHTSPNGAGDHVVLFYQIIIIKTELMQIPVDTAPTYK